MKKKMINLSIAVAGALLLSACGSDSSSDTDAGDTAFSGTLLGSASATVCVDENRNKSCDADELSTTTTDGTFSLEMSNAQRAFHIVAEMEDGSLMEGDTSLGGEISALTTLSTYKNDLRPAEQVKEIHETLLKNFQISDDNIAAKNTLLYTALKDAYVDNGVADLSASERVGTILYARSFVYNNALNIMEGIDYDTTDDHKDETILTYSTLPEIESLKIISDVYTTDFLFAGAGRGGLWLRQFKPELKKVMGKQDVNVSEAMGGLENIELVEVSSLHTNNDGSYAVDIPGIMSARDSIRYVQIEDLGERTLKVNELIRDYTGSAAEMDIDFEVGDKRYQEEHQRAHIPVTELSWSRQSVLDTDEASLDDFIASYSSKDMSIAYDDNLAYFGEDGAMEAYNTVKAANLSQSAGSYYYETHDDVKYLLVELPIIPGESHGRVSYGKYNIYKFDTELNKIVSLSYNNFTRWGGCGIKKFNLSALNRALNVIRANDPEFE